MAEGAPSRQGPILRSIKKILVLLLIFYIAQVFLQEPAKRPITACWPPYLLSRGVLVKVPQWFTPKEHLFIIEQAYRTERWNRACIDFVGGMSWITKGQKPIGVDEAEAGNFDESTRER